MRTRCHRNILIFSLLMVLIVFSAVGGVCASWHYETGNALPMKMSMTMDITPWTELPTGNEGIIIEETGTAIETSLNDPNSGLNSSISSKQSWGLKSISSVDNLHGADLRTELGIDKTANFLVEFPDDRTRIVYTTTVRIGGSSRFGAVNYLIPRGEWIYPVYRTVATLNANGVWEQGPTLRGYAKSDEYVTFLSAAPFFDPSSWTRGKIGSSIDNAIYCYNGQRVVAVLDSETEKAYYKMTFADAKVRTKLTIAKPATGKVTVLDSNGVPLTVRNNGTSAVKFTNPNANMTYYIEITGGTEVALDIM